MKNTKLSTIAPLTVMIACCAFSARALSQAGSSKSLAVIQGKLLADAHGPQLRVGQKVYSLMSDSPPLLHTLSDPHLRLREVRLEGTLKPHGEFEVAHLFIVKDGQLYKVRYYCNVCNITAQEPGRCVCCQRPTELQEIPVNDVTPDMVVIP